MSGTAGTANYQFSPGDEVYIVEYCKDLKSPVVVHGTVYRVDIVVKYESIPQTTTEYKYMIRTEYSEKVLVEDSNSIFSDIVTAVGELQNRLEQMALNRKIV